MNPAAATSAAVGGDEASRAAPLSIDLNQLPISPPLDSPTPPTPRPAFPGEAGAGPAPPTCPLCAQPELRGATLVCDGCDRGFHLACVRVQLPRRAGAVEEWMCGECSRAGGDGKGWSLGSVCNKAAQAQGQAQALGLIDMNAPPPPPPPSDADDDDEREASPCSTTDKVHPQKVEFILALPSQEIHSNSAFSRNGVGKGKFSLFDLSSVRGGFEDLNLHSLASLKTFEDTILNSPLHGMPGGNTATLAIATKVQGEMLLQALREYLRERLIILCEGWRVVFKPSNNGCNTAVCFCSPEGRRFESMLDVACYLDAPANGSSMVNYEKGTPIQKGLLSRRKKSSRAGNLVDNVDGVLGDPQFPPFCVGITKSYFEDNVQVVNAYGQQSDNSTDRKASIDLPVQYENFFILSLGNIDSRPTYHSPRQIWPIGFKSCWHDELTGSFFTCEVTDGGDSGPLFKVWRCPCSAMSIPEGSTLFFFSETDKTANNSEGELEHLKTCEEESLLHFFSDPSLSMQDLGSCFDSALHQSAWSEHFQGFNTCSKDELGEFIIESRSTSSVWTLVRQKIVEACKKNYQQSGRFQASCNHGLGLFASNSGTTTCKNGLGLFVSNSVTTKALNCMKPLLKFHCSEFKSASLGINSQEKFDTFCNFLEKWLDDDRFGLDLSFVLEMLENLPGAQSCIHYNLPRHSTGIYQSDGANLHISKSIKNTRENSFMFNTRSEILFDENVDKDSKLGSQALVLGRSLSRRLPTDLVGDVVEIWEMLSRFSESLELDTPPTFEDLERELFEPWFDEPDCFDKLQNEIGETRDIKALNAGSKAFNLLPFFPQPAVPLKEHSCEIFISVDDQHSRELSQAKLASSTYERCMGVALTKVHIALLKVLLGELHCKVAAFLDPTDGGDAKLRRGRKREIDCAVTMKRTKIDMLPINEFTWPELAQRYILSYLAMNGKLDSAECISRECGKVFRCLQGDGGVLCGALTGVSGMEADAMLLAEAERQIYFSKREGADFNAECKISEMNGSNEIARVIEGNLPEWAQLLQPVKKLPTNVGTRIRKCVFNALEKDPPDWAKKILEHSISKEVYKGNASGPTKKAVLNLLNMLGENKQPIPERKVQIVNQRERNSVPKMIMKQCRITLRRAAASDEEKTFCNLLGKSSLYPNDNEDEGLLGSPAVLSRPLDFRTIDLKLAAGAYGGSHEAFHEDVREVWQNISIAYRDRSDLMQLAEKLSQNFESLYEKEVLDLVDKLDKRINSESTDGTPREVLDDLGINEIPKAPWEDGVCKVCGIDRDDDSVLLCDSCDSEYHTYCLDPPLSRIPEGNWYCPSCVKSQTTGRGVFSVPQVTGRGVISVPQVSGKRLKKRNQSEDVRAFMKTLNDLAVNMGEKEYWELTVRERTFLLKFLCNEALNLTAIREHLDKCAEMTSDLQQKLRSLVTESKNLKFTGSYLSSRASNEPALDVIISNNGCVDVKEKDENGSKEVLHEGVQTENGLNEKRNLPNDKKLMCFPCEPSSTADVEMQNVDSISSTQHKLNAIDCRSDRNYNADDSLNTPVTLNFLSGMMKTPSIEQVPFVDCPLQSEQTATAHNRKASEDTDMCEPKEAFSLEASSLKTGTNLQHNISEVWNQLFKVALRRDFLGRDADGYLYWALNSPHGCPWLVICGSKVVQQNKRQRGPFVKAMQPDESGPTWVSILTDSDILELASSLRDDNLSEVGLKQSILQWLQFRPTRFGSQAERCNEILKITSKYSNDGENAYPFLFCKASTVLEKRYGSFCEPEGNDHSRKRGKKAKVCHEERMFRCECLEPVWPSRYHCISCHETFSSASELEGHNGGKCVPGSAVLVEGKRCEKDSVLVDDVIGAEWKKGSINTKVVKFPSEPDCPYDFEEISKKFIMRSSNKELVKEIGLIGTNGNPLFISSSLFDKTLLSPTYAVEEMNEVQIIPFEGPFGSSVGTGSSLIGEPRFCTTNKACTEMNDGEDLRVNCASGKIHESGSSQSFTVPQPALRFLTGRDSQIIRRLKINLLDMESALLNEALRPSRGSWHRRCAWRAFVKKARTIFEMIQATFVFEDMIRSDHLRNERWYWSSFSAAARTSTLSALALRIYSLDSAVMYEGGSTELLEISRTGKSGKRKREGDG